MLLVLNSFETLQAGIAALPRLHPGLLVARAQAADLAARLQAHAQVRAPPDISSVQS